MASAYAVIDKIGRDSNDKTRERLNIEARLNADQTDRVLAIFAQNDFESVSRAYGDVPAIEAELARLRSYFSQLADLGLEDYVRFDASIVRGLAYYTGIVFEIFDRQGELRAVCGGGRYDNLLKNVGGVDLPALGFGMGDVVLGELLADRGLLAAYRPQIDYYIIAVTETERSTQKQLARRLRDGGHSVSYNFRTGSIGKQFKDADARGARHTIVLGPDEVAGGVAVVKEMSTGAEMKVKLDEIGR
jgi:histidyl-tRNA synthetase